MSGHVPNALFMIMNRASMRVFLKKIVEFKRIFNKFARSLVGKSGSSNRASVTFIFAFVVQLASSAFITQVSPSSSNIICRDRSQGRYSVPLPRKSMAKLVCIDSGGGGVSFGCGGTGPPGDGGGDGGGCGVGLVESGVGGGGVSFGCGGTGPPGDGGGDGGDGGGGGVGLGDGRGGGRSGMDGGMETDEFASLLATLCKNENKMTRPKAAPMTALPTTNHFPAPFRFILDRGGAGDAPVLFLESKRRTRA